MFQIGLEFDFAHLTERQQPPRRGPHRHRQHGRCLSLLGFGLRLATARRRCRPASTRFASALFVATALSITALPILGRIMMEFEITRLPHRRDRHQRRRHQRRHRLAAARAHHGAHAGATSAPGRLRPQGGCWSARFSSPGGSSCSR
ncbi:MAG: hypothetical protein MZW92_37780 [Comamonadaceae bacterium]|nr:hypothetical protein [Comamonadaceae bacterium]